MQPKFELGQTLITTGAEQALAESGQGHLLFLARHAGGDWGSVSRGDAEENDVSVQKGYRIFSVYHTAKGVKLWVITEADRSTTTILLPEEY